MFVVETFSALCVVPETVPAYKLPFKNIVPVAERFACVVEFCWKVKKLPLKLEDALIPR
jgi:hypothetical protein